MTLYLSGYNYEPRMCVVAKDSEMLSVLIAQNTAVMFINGNHVIFYPDKVTVPINNAEMEKVSCLANRDIVELYSNGLIYRSFANEEPDSTLFLGARCNSSCIMCPASDRERKNGVSYSREQIEQYIDFLPSDLDVLVVTGGEPTLHPHIFLPAMQKLKEKFTYSQVLLLTNGRALSNDGFLNEFLNVCPSNLAIAIPIHGDTAQLHDLTTRTPGSFDETGLAIRKLLARKVRVELRVVVTKINYKSLYGISRLIAREFKEAMCVNFVGLEPRGNCAANSERVYIDHKRAFLWMKRPITFLMERGIDVGIYNFPLCAVDRGFWCLCKRSISEYKATYHEKCVDCIVMELCGGFFESTLAFIRPDVDPFVPEGVGNVKSL